MLTEIASVCTRPSVTSALISAQFLVFAAQCALGSPRLELACAQIQPAPHGGEHYRLITACFLHASVAHLLSNTVAIARLCPVLATVLSVEAIWLVFLLSGVAGNLASMAWGSAPHEVALAWLARHGVDHTTVLSLLAIFGIEPPHNEDAETDAEEQVTEDTEQPHLAAPEKWPDLPAPTRRRLERIQSLGVGASGSIYGQSGAVAGFAMRNPSRASMTAAAAVWLISTTPRTWEAMRAVCCLATCSLPTPDSTGSRRRSSGHQSFGWPAASLLSLQSPVCARDGELHFVS
jgi:membrane associated rhomboid family serine protease